MLNVYDKFDKPEGLSGYCSDYHINLLVTELTGPNNHKISPSNKKLLKQYKEKFMHNKSAVQYFVFNISKKRWPEVESFFIHDAWAALTYAITIKKRWQDIGYPEVEDIIAKETHRAVEYAELVIGGRWPEAEPYIMKGVSDSVEYAENIIHKRWADIGLPEAESYIMKSPYWSYKYARDVIKGRWKEAETIIKDDASVWTNYKNHFGIEE